MPLPDVIPIAHEPDYRTETIGTYDGGQFFASVTAAYRQTDWNTRRHDEIRWYVVLHLFGRARATHSGGPFGTHPAYACGDTGTPGKPPLRPSARTGSAAGWYGRTQTITSPPVGAPPGKDSFTKVRSAAAR
jgi:hypothetical protein